MSCKIGHIACVNGRTGYLVVHSWPGALRDGGGANLFKQSELQSFILAGAFPASQFVQREEVKSKQSESLWHTGSALRCSTLPVQRVQHNGCSNISVKQVPTVCRSPPASFSTPLIFSRSRSILIFGQNIDSAKSFARPETSRRHLRLCSSIRIVAGCICIHSQVLAAERALSSQKSWR